jgi:hypothetical protein
MKKLKEAKNHVKCDALRFLQDRELRQVDGGGTTLNPSAVRLPGLPTPAPRADW